MLKWPVIYSTNSLLLKCKIDNKPTSVQIMAWHRTGDKPLSEPMMAYLTLSRWVNKSISKCGGYPHLNGRQQLHLTARMLSNVSFTPQEVCQWQWWRHRSAHRGIQEPSDATWAGESRTSPNDDIRTATKIWWWSVIDYSDSISMVMGLNSPTSPLFNQLMEGTTKVGTFTILIHLEKNSSDFSAQTPFTYIDQLELGHP